MALYVDSAVLDEVAAACARYPVAGVTTNPSLLLAATERGQRLSDLEVLRELLHVCSGTIFMQPMAQSPDDAEALRAAAERYIERAPDRVVPKLPPTPAGLQAGTALTRAGGRVAFTAVCSLGQAYCAAQAGAGWIIPYFGRVRRAGEDACELISHMVRLLSVEHCGTRVLVASVKSPADLLEATLAGAHDATVQPGIIADLLDCSLTNTALEQFHTDWSKARAVWEEVSAT